jgi:hypothetical protein
MNVHHYRDCYASEKKTWKIYYEKREPPTISLGLDSHYLMSVGRVRRFWWRLSIEIRPGSWRRKNNFFLFLPTSPASRRALERAMVVVFCQDRRKIKKKRESKCWRYIFFFCVCVVSMWIGHEQAAVHRSSSARRLSPTSWIAVIAALIGHVLTIRRKGLAV